MGYNTKFSGVFMINKRIDWNKRVRPFCICFTVYAWRNVIGFRGSLRGTLRGSLRTETEHWLRATTRLRHFWYNTRQCNGATP